MPMSHSTAALLIPIVSSLVVGGDAFRQRHDKNNHERAAALNTQHANSTASAIALDHKSDGEIMTSLNTQHASTGRKRRHLVETGDCCRDYMCNGGPRMCSCTVEVCLKRKKKWTLFGGKKLGKCLQSEPQLCIDGSFRGVNRQVVNQRRQAEMQRIRAENEKRAREAQELRSKQQAEAEALRRIELANKRKRDQEKRREEQEILDRDIARLERQARETDTYIREGRAAIRATREKEERERLRREQELDRREQQQERLKQAIANGWVTEKKLFGHTYGYEKHPERLPPEYRR